MSGLENLRTRAAVLLVGTFILGCICGAALLLLGQRSIMGPHHPHFEDPSARLTHELNLDAGQQQQVHDIIERHRSQMHAIIEDSRREIRAVLRPDQQEKFDRMRPHMEGPPPGEHGQVPMPPPPPDKGNAGGSPSSVQPSPHHK